MASAPLIVPAGCAQAAEWLDATSGGALAERVVVLDGGLATELERRGHDLADSLWSARQLIDDPDEICSAHRAYFNAGAEIAPTASY